MKKPMKPMAKEVKVKVAMKPVKGGKGTKAC